MMEEKGPSGKGTVPLSSRLADQGGQGAGKRKVIVEIHLERERFVQVTTRQRE